MAKFSHFGPYSAGDDTLVMGINSKFIRVPLRRFSFTVSTKMWGRMSIDLEEFSQQSFWATNQDEMLLKNVIVMEEDLSKGLPKISGNQQEIDELHTKAKQTIQTIINDSKDKNNADEMQKEVNIYQAPLIALIEKVLELNGKNSSLTVKGSEFESTKESFRTRRNETYSQKRQARSYFPLSGIPDVDSF